MSIQINNISKSFAARNIFEGLSLQVGAKSRVGLIGRNGCGKSTLLKIIMGELHPEEGTIYRAPNMKINHLSQEPRITLSFTLEEEMRSVFKDLHALEVRENELIRKLNEEAESEEEHLALVNRLITVQAEMERLGASSMDARIGRILKGLGFSLADHQRKTGEFSGGWRMRINLAKVLLEGADILLLDEPTNHLDLEACEWMEDFLKDYPGGLILVSHDRRFLDQITTEIAELQNGAITVWPGNYTAHLEQKEAAQEQQLSAYERQQKDLAKQTAFVERFKASATRGTQAKSREKQLDKIERLEAPTSDAPRMAFRFPAPDPSGREVLTLRNLQKAFGDKKLFNKLDADLERKQRVFLLGANGTGKTTLLRLILGLESPDAGEISQGHNVSIGYFSQNQLETLDPNVTVLDTLQTVCPLLSNTELRTLLGRFLFRGDQVFKPVSVLSGGEKSKLALAKLMLSGPNTLLLDEPTNHMDIPSKDVMADALGEYEGSILCISHDRHFMQQLATDIWEIYNGRLITYGGDYDYYLFKREQMRARVDAELAQAARKGKPAPSPATSPSNTVAQAEKVPAATNATALNSPASANKAKTASKPNDAPIMGRKETEKKLKKAEKQILAIESEIAALETELVKPNIQQDYQALHTLSSTLEGKKHELAQINETWSQLAESLA
jgi:ATP-binding cassette, subfamily F, member 3